MIYACGGAGKPLYLPGIEKRLQEMHNDSYVGVGVCCVYVKEIMVLEIVPLRS